MDDPQNVLTLTLQGPYGEYNSGAKLGFGDFGRQVNNGWNVFVGEWGNHDSDMLWLHGKNGVRLTVLDGTRTAAEWECRDSFFPRFRFYDGLQLDRLIVSCDDHHKKDITPIETPLHRLLALSGVRYRYIPIDRLSGGGESNPPLNPSEKEIAAAAQATAMQNLHSHGDVRYGLLAHEVAHVFPELVETDKEGNQYVNYIELIPVLISAMQELVGHRGAGAFTQPTGWETFRGDSEADTAAGSSHRTLGANSRSVAASSTLYQNTPNPFASATEIAYFIPSASSASIHIFNLSGLLLKTYPIDAFGHGSIEISASSLLPGMYLYTLVVDGQIIDTKRMILTE